MLVVYQPTTSPIRNIQIILEYYTRELLICNRNPPKDLVYYSTIEVVATVNTTISTKYIVVICRFPSSNIILTFQDTIPKTTL
jgi:hypothetical protein